MHFLSAEDGDALCISTFLFLVTTSDVSDVSDCVDLDSKVVFLLFFLFLFVRIGVDTVVNTKKDVSLLHL